MWKQWKNKMKKVLENDTTKTNDREQSAYKQQQNITPKITYQYPEKKAFRFPVIPDESIRNHKEEEDTPAFQRRHQVRQRNVKDEKLESDRPKRKVYKSEDSPPFQPTDVPSPIYGYQKRESKIENIPAFQRKQEENNKSFIAKKQVDKVVLFEESTNKDHRQETNHDQPEEKPVIKQHTEKTTDTERSPIDKEKTHKENRSVERDIKPLQQIVKESREHTNMKTQQNPSKMSQRSKKRTERRRKTQHTSKTPFNVMMTPSDKQLYEQNHVLNTDATKVSIEKDMQAKQEMNQATEQVNDISIPMHLLNDTVPSNHENDFWIIEQQRLLEQTLKHFNVLAKVVKSTQGPSVTRFEVQPEMGVKVSKIRNLSDDLKLNMSAKDIRIEAPIPGKNTVGIEVPNPSAQAVGLQEIFEADSFKNSTSPLTIALGLNIEGEPKITNIQKMPHGLIAGATGSGKSVCINSLLISILYKASYEDVKFLLIDPKMVELAPYNGIPHLVAPVITDVKAATQSLKWAVNEMEERYERFVEAGVRDIERFNRKVMNDDRPQDKMPYIVIVIDELADLMMVSPQDVENSISRIAQKARACGIHLLLATQRPSVDVITGLIKANIPTRIAFSVSSQVDSRTILDSSGAEKLLGKGDMLFMENGTGKSVRLQGPFVSDEEIERVTAYVRELAEPEYLFEQEQLLEQVHMEEDEDELLEAAIQFVLHQQSASTSMLQRHFKIGYNRAARLIDTLELKGIISGQNGSKPREVLVTESSAMD